MLSTRYQDRPGPPVLSVLRCQACGRAEQLREDDLVPYVLAGWPTCCGKVMDLPAPVPDVRPTSE